MAPEQTDALALGDAYTTRSNARNRAVSARSGATVTEVRFGG
jgi:hypothetical protein